MHPNVNWIPQLSGLCSDHLFPFSAWPVVLHPVCMYLSAQLCQTLFHPMNCGSLGFSQQEYWYGLLFHPPRNLPDPGIVSPMAPTLAGRFSSTWATWAVHSTSLYLSKCALITNTLCDATVSPNVFTIYCCKSARFWHCTLPHSY